MCRPKSGNISLLESALFFEGVGLCVQILLNFVFCLERLSEFQSISKHANIFKFSFLHFKLQLFFKQHICFLDVSNSTLLLQKN